MNEAIRIIQADMREFFRAGHSIHEYRRDHVIWALIVADIDPRSLKASPQALLMAALLNRCNKALDQ